jgi:hypothetical protein
MESEARADYVELESGDSTYHSVSALAVLALVLGLLAPLAFVHVLLWTIPIVGAALSAIAFIRIDRSEGALIGRKAALVGLVLSLLFGSCAIAYVTTHRLWLARRAERVAERFFALLSEGKTYAAHQLWADPQYRFLLSDDYEALYAEHPQAEENRQIFLKREVVKDLIDLGKNAEIEHQRTELTFSVRPQLANNWTGQDLQMVWYHLSGKTADRTISKDIKLVIERLVRDTGETWRVASEEVVVE